MRIALVSPYSWTYPGGVTRHIEALAAQFIASGHDVRVFAPFDPPDRLSARMHRGARPEVREKPDWLVPLGRTIGVKANGAVSNLSLTPYAVTTLRRELRAGDFDVIHIHEPHTPVVGYDALDATSAPLVGTVMTALAPGETFGGGPYSYDSGSTGRYKAASHSYSGAGSGFGAGAPQYGADVPTSPTQQVTMSTPQSDGEGWSGSPQQLD